MYKNKPVDYFFPTIKIPNILNKTFFVVYFELQVYLNLHFKFHLSLKIMMYYFKFVNNMFI